MALPDENAERRSRALPTRDELMRPTLTNYNRRQSENEARIVAVRRGQARDLLRRTLMREPTPEEIEQALAR